LHFESDFLQGSDISQHSIKNDPKKKEDNTIVEEIGKEELKNRARNQKSSWCILSFTLSHVVLLFNH
jgi:hypothetical protein